MIIVKVGRRGFEDVPGSTVERGKARLRPPALLLSLKLYLPDRSLSIEGDILLDRIGILKRHAIEDENV